MPRTFVAAERAPCAGNHLRGYTDYKLVHLGTTGWATSIKQSVEDALGTGGLLFVLCVTTSFICVGRAVGYVDALIALAALFVLIGIVAYPRPVRLLTTVHLALLTFLLLWANLRPTAWQRLYGGTTPRGLDPITAAMFWRGWPISPCQVSLVHGLTYHPEGTRSPLILDGFVFVAILLLAKVISQCCLGGGIGHEEVIVPRGLKDKDNAGFRIDAQREDSGAANVNDADRQNSRIRPYQFGLGSLLLYLTLSALFLATSRTLYLRHSPGVFALWVIVVGWPLFSIFLSGLVVLCAVVARFSYAKA